MSLTDDEICLVLDAILAGANDIFGLTEDQALRMEWWIESRRDGEEARA